MDDTYNTETLVATAKAKVFAYIDPDLKKQLEDLAEKRNRSVSNLIETLVMEEVERAKSNGELQPENSRK